MPCITCRTSKVVSIAVNVGGTKVTMHSCSTCDRRFWERDGEGIALDRVLSLAGAR